MTGYDALRNTCAFIDLSARGKLRATGEDRIRLLHAMSTNDVAHMQEGNELYSFFLNAQGRILADAYIYHRGEALWLDTEPEAGDRLFEHLDKYIIADDVTLENLTVAWAAIGIEGPTSAEAAKTLASAGLPPDGFVVPIASSSRHGFRVFLPASGKAALIEVLQNAGVPEASASEARIVRIENEIPRYGDDISERYLVQETEQTGAVHANKGCYLGQEIVERVRSRGQVHRLLKPVEIAASEPPAPGQRLRVADKEMGEITSAVWSPALGKVVGFAYLRGEALLPDAEFTLGETGIKGRKR